MITAEEALAKFAPLVTDTIQLLNNRLGAECPEPSLTWDLVDEDVFGMSIGSRLIRLNPAAAIVLGDDYAETVVHEAAHSVTTWRQVWFLQKGRLPLGFSPHGLEWKRAMRITGYKARRLISISTKQNQRLIECVHDMLEIAS